MSRHNLPPCRITHLAPRVPAVSPERELTREEVIHAQVEEDDVALGAVTEVDGRVDAQVHIAVNGCIVVTDKQSPRGGEERRKG